MEIDGIVFLIYNTNTYMWIYIYLSQGLLLDRMIVSFSLTLCVFLSVSFQAEDPAGRGNPLYHRRVLLCPEVATSPAAVNV